MLKYFALIFISLTCLASEPKFHYMDCVKIIDGFYTGCKGHVVSYRSSTAEGPNYNVDVEDCKGQGFFDYFDEDQLEACKK
jgi:hypothetical protein